MDYRAVDRIAHRIVVNLVFDARISNSAVMRDVLNADLRERLVPVSERPRWRRAVLRALVDMANVTTAADIIAEMEDK